MSANANADGSAAHNSSTTAVSASNDIDLIRSLPYDKKPGNGGLVQAQQSPNRSLAEKNLLTKGREAGGRAKPRRP